MEFRILGPLEVIDGDNAVALPGPRQRGLLAFLLLHANQVVSSSRLIEELWPGEALGAHAGGAAGERLAAAQGARLRRRAPRHRRARLRRPGRRRSSSTSTLRAPRRGGRRQPIHRRLPGKLREALGLWRGPALADLAYEPFAQAAIGRLEDLHLLAVERRIDADLALGQHAQLVPELEALAAEHPLRERLRGQLMLALYRAGRQAEALEPTGSREQALVDELGIDPGPALQELERAMLRQDPSLELARRRPRALDPRRVAGDGPLEPLLALAEPLARKEPREMIVARVLADRAGLAAAAGALKEHTEALAGSAASRRGRPCSRSTSAGADTSRLATEQDVDLILVAAPAALLDDPDLADLLRTAPCDVAVLVGGEPAPGPVLVPFAGTDHDWSAIELGAWLAGSWQVPLRLAGPAVEGGRDSSRLLASASLAVQRALGVAAEPLLVEPGPDALVAAAAGRRRHGRRPVRPLAQGRPRPDPRRARPQAATRRCSCARACGRAASRRPRT